MNRKEAEKYGDQLVENLRPYCEKIAIAGSIRRMKEVVKDIEIVCIPKYTNDEFGDLFQKKLVRTPEFISIIRSMEIIKGKPEDGKYVQCVHPGGIKVDLFIANPDNWGIIYLIRTGSADFSKKMMYKLKTAGYPCIDGHIYHRGKMIPMKEEKDVFDLVKMQIVPPFQRIN